MEEKKYTVYVHITPNNKKYYGITGTSLNSRFGKNGYNYKACTLFYKAIQKYGWDNIKHKIVAHGLTREQAKKLETKLILYYRTNEPEYGYNLTSGGETNIPNSQTIEKMRNALKGIFAGEKNYFYGKRGKDALNATSVICLETKRIFETVIEAGAFYNITPSVISNCCSRRINTAKKLHWMYYKDFLNASEECIMNLLSIPANNQSKAVKIICLETNNVFDSILSASKKLKIDRKALKKVLRGKRSKIHNLHFMYYTDYLKLTPEELQQKLNNLS